VGSIRRQKVDSSPGSCQCDKKAAHILIGYPCVLVAQAVSIIKVRDEYVIGRQTFRALEGRDLYGGSSDSRLSEATLGCL